MQDEKRIVRGKLEERRNELNRGCFEKKKPEGNMLQEEIGFKWKNKIKVDLEETG